MHTGVDTALVAPVNVGDGAYTGAGSVITEDVPPGAVFVPYAYSGVELNRLGIPTGTGLRVTARPAAVAQRAGA